MTRQDTIDRLRDLRLSVMARTYRDLDDAPGVSQMGFDEKLAMLVDAEWDSRRENKRARLLKQAGFPEPSARVEDVLYYPDRELDRDQMLTLARCKWVEDGRNVIVTGASGAGKTWLSNALGAAACETFHSVCYARLPEMLDVLCASRDEAWAKAKARYAKCDLLIVDDWLLDVVKPAQTREILEVVERRSRSGSLMLCSQFPAQSWHERLGKGAVADAVIDRIVYNSYTVHVKGEESMRKRTSTI